MNSIDAINNFDLANVQVNEIKKADIESALTILADNLLESWSFRDFEMELDREDSIMLAVRYKEELIGFAITRLITNWKSSADQIENSNEISEIKENMPNLNEPMMFVEQTKSFNSEYNDEFDGECEIYNIAVKKRYQDSGVGCKLLNHLIRIAANRQIGSIWLEVRKSNAQALNFYRRNGFAEVDERRNFYANPTENAKIMKRMID